jgi:flagellar basal body-associated protein FliL
MDKHHKSKRLKRIVQWLIYIFIFLMGLFAVYYALSHKKSSQTNEQSHQTTEYVKTTT